MTEGQIRQALHDCYDPEISLNIVDLGKVSTVEVRLDADAPGAGIPGIPERYSVLVTLLAAGREEGLDEQIAALVHNRLAGLPQVSRISVQIASDRVWTPALISAAGRRMLGLDRQQFPILNNRVR